MNLSVSLFVTLIIFVSAQDLHHTDGQRSQYHHQGRQAGSAAQGHRASTSAHQGGHSSSSSSTQRRTYVSRDGRPYYQYSSHVSTSGGRGGRQVGEGRENASQTVDHPYRETRVRTAELSGRTGYTNNGRGQAGTRTYPQQQHHGRYYSSSSSSSSSSDGGGNSDQDSRANQRTGGHETRYDARTESQGRRYAVGGGTNQRRDYGPSRSNTGQVYNRYHLSGSNRTSQSRNADSTWRTRYIRPGYGPSISGRSALGRRGSFGTVQGHGARQETGAYSRGTGRSQSGGRSASGRSETGSRTASYTRNGGQRQTNFYRQSRISTRGGDECPQSGVELRIDGLPCDRAVRRFGLSLCYTHEFSSRKCCQACRPRRNQNKPGCEYGDRAQQCSSIRPADCYNAENRRICCNACERLKRSDTPGCEYGDRSNRCDAVRAKPGLCYHRENRRMCCESCARREDTTRPDCPYGDRNPQLCRPFEDNTSTVRINCYSHRTRNACCNSCRRLKEWVPDDLPASCEYGDQPVKFITQQMGDLTCSTYFNYFPVQHCALPDSDVARFCCHTCYRRRAHVRG